ncbi:MAG TPA: hypothetical protein VFR36_00945 [Sphingomicrobium sp.]|nr:hypothetical protein [Sphingomicrobium sp.]
MRVMLSTAMSAALLLMLPACQQQEAASDAPAAAAASLEALNGTWKVDLASLKFEQKPNEFLLKDGSYSCSTCLPPLTSPADGQYHPVADRPYYDSMQIKTVDDRTVEFHRKKGDKEVSSNVLTVSEDGNKLTNKFHDATTPNSPPIDGEVSSTRAGPAPEGAHAISGQWMPDRFADYSEQALDITYQVSGKTVTQTSQGQSWTAEIGGPAVAIQNDPGGTMVAVAAEGASGLRETYTRDGKEIGVTTIVPSADGTSFNFTNFDPRDQSKVTWTANKK